MQYQFTQSLNQGNYSQGLNRHLRASTNLGIKTMLSKLELLGLRKRWNMGWFSTSFFLDVDQSYGDHELDKEKLRSEVSIPITDSIKTLIEAQKETQIDQTEGLEVLSSDLSLLNETSVQNQQVLEAGNALLAEQNEAITFVGLGVHNLQEEMKGQGALLNWKLSDLGAKIDRLNATLSEILEVLKLPSQTWSAEQFSIARDAYSKNLWSEALRHINFSVNGDGLTQTGYRLESSYHFLKGLIIQEGVRAKEFDLSTLKNSEAAYIDSAKTSQKPSEKSFGYVGAALSVLKLGDIELAAEHLKSALEHSPEHAEANYLYSHYLYSQGQHEKAGKYLLQAYISEHSYVHKSLLDTAMIPYIHQRDEVILKYHSKLLVPAKQNGQRLNKKFSFYDASLGNYLSKKDTPKTASEQLDEDINWILDKHKQKGLYESDKDWRGVLYAHKHAGPLLKGSGHPYLDLLQNARLLANSLGRLDKVQNLTLEQAHWLALLSHNDIFQQKEAVLGCWGYEKKGVFLAQRFLKRAFPLIDSNKNVVKPQLNQTESNAPTTLIQRLFRSILGSNKNSKAATEQLRNNALKREEIEETEYKRATKIKVSLHRLTESLNELENKII